MNAVGDEQADPLLRETSQLVEIDEPVIDRGGIELEVARVNDQSGRSDDGEPDRIGNTVRDPERLQLENAGD